MVRGPANAVAWDLKRHVCNILRTQPHSMGDTQ